MTLRMAFLVLSSLALLMGACLDTDDRGTPGEATTVTDELIGSFDHAVVTGDVSVRNATLVGDLGRTTGLRHYATAVDSFSDGHWASIYVTVDTGAAAGMTIVDIWDLSQLDLANAGAATSPGISIIGCAGDEPGVWDYDQSADEVEVDVTENPANPGEITVAYTATFRDYSQMPIDGDYYDPSAVPELRTQTVTGSVTFMRPEIRNDYAYDYNDAPVAVDGTSAP